MNETTATRTPSPPGPGAPLPRHALDILLRLALFVVFVTTFVVQAFRITSGSLEPTLRVGDFVLVNRMIYDNAGARADRFGLPRRSVRRGDLVVFKDPHDPGRDLVKRIIGLPGERLEIANKGVLIDEVPLLEPYVIHVDSFIFTRANPVSQVLIRRDNFGPYEVPAGTVFVMGDNRDDSDDSRFWGVVPLASLKGRPWLVYFSYELARDDERKTAATGRLRNIRRSFPALRLDRVFSVVR